MDNDYAEYLRLEQAYELGNEATDPAWDWWSQEVEKVLINAGVTAPAVGLDGEEETDGFSFDYAYEAFNNGDCPEEYLAKVFDKREEMGL